MYTFVDDASGMDVDFSDVIDITSDVYFTNNGCRINFPR